MFLRTNHKRNKKNKRNNNSNKTTLQEQQDKGTKRKSNQQQNKTLYRARVVINLIIFNENIRKQENNKTHVKIKKHIISKRGRK